MMTCPNCEGVGHTSVSGHCRTCNGTGKLSDYVTFMVPDGIKEVRIAAAKRRWKFREITQDGLCGPWQWEDAEVSSNGVTTCPFLKAGCRYEIFIGDNDEGAVMVFFYGPRIRGPKSANLN